MSPTFAHAVGYAAWLHLTNSARQLLAEAEILATDRATTSS